MLSYSQPNIYLKIYVVSLHVSYVSVKIKIVLIMPQRSLKDGLAVKRKNCCLYDLPSLSIVISLLLHMKSFSLTVALAQCLMNTLAAL